jgi:transposase
MSNILSIDLGKFNSAVCIFDRSSLKSKFKTIRTRKQVMHDLFVEYQDKIEIVLFETGSQMGWVADILWALKIPFKVANTNHSAWKWKNNPNKSDRKDAQRLAMMYNTGFFPTVHVPKRDVRQKRSLIVYRDDLVKRITKIKNSIRAILSREDIHQPGGKKGWTIKALVPIRELAMDINEIDDPEEYWKGQLNSELIALDNATALVKTLESKLDALGEDDERIKRLRTIPAVGPRLSETVVAIIDDPHRFKNGRQVGSYIGMVPRRYQSGQVDITGRISKCGNKLLRTLLIEVSWLGLREPWMREIYDKVRRGDKKRSKVAIVAVARQLLVRCWAILRDESCWDADHAKRLAKSY